MTLHRYAKWLRENWREVLDAGPAIAFCIVCFGIGCCIVVSI